MASKPIGWRREPARHSLAAKGVKTKRSDVTIGKVFIRGKNQYKIESIEMEEILDESPDLSFYGEFSNTPKEGAIDVKEQGDWDSGKYRYFNPAMQENPMELYRRMVAYDKGLWNMEGIRAKAKVLLSTDGGKTWKSHTISSGGLWGVESDSGNDYKNDIFREEREELAKQLRAFNFR